MDFLKEIESDPDEFINSIKKDRNNLVFLAGAGISMDPPSNLSSAGMITESILEFIAPDEDILKELSEIKELRFEYLMQLFRDYFDNDLRILDYFNDVYEPNLLHYMLASEMKRGNTVLTTNFDNLIERAYGVESSDLRIVISEDDFNDCSNPDEVYSLGKVPLYKLHGSKLNVKTGENTSKWVVITLDTLGKREKSKIFSVPHYQKDLFEVVAKNKTLIVLGYSGGDDFDIVPGLRLMRDIKRVVWIEHENGYDGEIKIFGVAGLDTDGPDYWDLNSRDKILIQMKTEGSGVFIIRGNTSDILMEITDYSGKSPVLTAQEPRKDSQKEFDEFLRENFNPPGKVNGLFISGLIFYNYGLYKKAMAVWNEALEMLGGLGDGDGVIADIGNNKATLIQKSALLSNLALIYLYLGNYDEALHYFRLSYEICRNLGDDMGMANQLGNMANIYYKRGDLEKSLEMYESSYEIDKKLNFIEGMAKALGNIGLIYGDMGDFDKAIEYYNEAYELDKQAGNLHDIAAHLGNSANLYASRGAYRDALELIHRAYEINKKLGDLQGMATQLGNISMIFLQMEDFDKALEYNRRSYELSVKLGNLDGISSDLTNIGIIYYKMGNIDESLNALYRALAIDEKLGNIPGKASIMGNIANVYYHSGRVRDVLGIYNEIYEIHAQMNNKADMATDLNNMGLVYMDLNDLDRALMFCRKALAIDEEIENISGITRDLENIAAVYLKSGSFDNALDVYSKLIGIYRQLNNKRRIAGILSNMGIVYANLEAFDKALDIFDESYRIFEGLNDMQEMANLWGNKGKVYSDLGLMEKAKDAFSRCYILSARCNYQPGMSYAVKNLRGYFKNEDELMEFLRTLL